MVNRALYKISLCDIILTGLFLILPVLSLASLWQQDEVNKKILVYHDDNLLATYHLHQDTIISISEKGMEMTIKIENDRVRVLESNCPKLVCVHFGWMSNPGQIIACVPNKTLIEVVGKQESKFHAESY